MASPNTVPLTYNGYVQQIATLAVVGYATTSGISSLNDPNAQAVLPQMLNYAELRIQRDLNLLPALTSQPLPYTLNAGTNILQLGANDFVTVESLQATIAGVPTPLTPVAKEFIQSVFNSAASAGPPVYFAPVGGDQSTGGTTYNNYLIGPWADNSYSINVYGVQRLPSLNGFGSSSTTAGSSYTFISEYYADLLLIASMIFVSGYQRNFGRMSDDPSMAQSYENQYQLLKASALGEEFRKRFQASDWTSQPQPTGSTGTRQP